MALTNRIKIKVYDNELDYKSAEELGIKFNRVVDDFSALDRRFGDFSYSFNLPITKNNSRIFKYANTHGSKNIFKPNRDLPCKVYNNDRLLLDGVISLQGVTEDSFNCIFYSKLKEFSDLIDDKNIRDLEFDTIDFDYEDTVMSVIDAEHADSDTTIWQFPFLYYGTVYTPTSTYTGEVDVNSKAFDQDTYPSQQFYYAMNDVQGNANNRFYIHQFPPVFYIIRIMEQIFSDAGWTIGGQWLNDENIKKIVMLYAGDNDIYDQATGEISGSATVTLQPAKLLPDMEQSEFLNGIINMFNLYLKIDIENKIIRFETYNTLFSDVFNPYDITSKIEKETMKLNYVENNNPSVLFQDAENMDIMGDNLTISGTSNNNWSTTYNKTDNVNLQAFFNHYGTTEEIEVPFSMPTVKRTYLWNDANDSGANLNTEETVFFQPCLAEQTPSDGGKKFNKNTGHTYVFNNEDTIKYRGKPCLMYYYGESTSDRIQKSGKGAQSDYFYFYMYSNSGATTHRVPIGICSPMQLSEFRTEVNSYLTSQDAKNSRKTITASYLQGLWNMMSSIADTVPVTTDFSLVFDDNGYMHETLWTKFHAAKYRRYQNSEMLEADIKMNDYDWNAMQIDRPILYNKEYYHLVEIRGYDPIKRKAKIKLIKTT